MLVTSILKSVTCTKISQQKHFSSWLWDRNGWSPAGFRQPKHSFKRCFWNTCLSCLVVKRPLNKNTPKKGVSVLSTCRPFPGEVNGKAALENVSHPICQAETIRQRRQMEMLMGFRIKRLLKMRLSHLSHLWSFSVGKFLWVGKTLPFSFEFSKPVFAMCLHQLSTPHQARLTCSLLAWSAKYCVWSTILPLASS